jgi:hypothetical protein
VTHAQAAVLSAGVGRTGRAGLVAMTLLSLLAVPLAAQPVERPRLEPARVTGELIAGAYAGIGGYFLGRHLAHEIAGVFGAESEATIRRVEFVGGAAGGILATAGAVYGIGSIGDQAGDFGETALGSAAGYLVAIGVARLVLGPDLRPEPNMGTGARWAIANVLALMPAVGGTIGFNSTRRSQ